MIKNIFLFCCLLFSTAACSSDHSGPGDPDNPDTPDIEYTEPQNFNANRLFIKHGLQLHCWVATDNFELGQKEGQPAYILNPNDWKLTGFTSPTFFGPPLINPSFFTHFPGHQWAIAKAPYGSHLQRGPLTEEIKNGFLSADQLQYLDQLTSICFGDEESFKFEYIAYLRDWFSICRRLYPNVLVHNNQFANQWGVSDMRMYIRQAKPDMIIYDWYYFHASDPSNYRGAKDMADHLMTYRNLALEGWSGDGSDYIAFGQYTQGFANEGTYRLTESQLRLYYFMTWTFGGKWLNWFRYLQGDGYGGKTASTEWALLLDHGQPGQPTHYMDWVFQCNQESKNIGAYLVRLKTKDVRYYTGTSAYTAGAPEKLYAWSPAASQFLKQIKAHIVGHPQERGDIYIGYFEPIPKQEQGDPGFFKNPEASWFMITNALTSKTDQTADALAQEITLSLDLSGYLQKTLSRIHPETGIQEKISGTAGEDGLINFTFTLPGGTGTLLTVE